MGDDVSLTAEISLVIGIVSPLIFLGAAYLFGKYKGYC